MEAHQAPDPLLIVKLCGKRGWPLDLQRGFPLPGLVIDVVFIARV